MPGPIEEAGKAANSLITGLSSQPVMLGLVVMNLAMVAMLFFVLRYSQEARRTEFQMVFDQQKQVADLLSRCVVTDK